MSNNRLPRKQSRLFSLAEDMAGGCKTWQEALGLKQNTEEVLRSALAAARKAQGEFGSKRSDRVSATGSLKLADAQARGFIKSARAVLVKFYGERFSAAWEQTGFPNRSTAVPRTRAERLVLCESLKNYFTAHPEHENAGMEVTAAIAQQHLDALGGRRKDRASAKTAAGEKKAARNQTLRTLRKRMRGLIGELATLLEDDDPCWHAFGLNKPGEPDRPQPPTGLALEPGLPGQARATWGRARNASRYRVWVRVEGVDADFRAVLSREACDAIIPDLPAGSTVQVRLTAVNEAGEESPPGEAVEIVMPGVRDP